MKYLRQKNRGFAFKCVCFQLLWSLACAAIGFLITLKSQIFASISLGGLTCVLPNLYFAHKFFTTTGALETKTIINSFYKAEAQKLLMACIVFWICFKYLDVRVAPYFLGYMVAHLAFWFSPFVLKRRKA